MGAASPLLGRHHSPAPPERQAYRRAAEIRDAGGELKHNPTMPNIGAAQAGKKHAAALLANGLSPVPYLCSRYFAQFVSTVLCLVEQWSYSVECLSPCCSSARYQ